MRQLLSDCATQRGLAAGRKNYALARLFALWNAASYIDLDDADLIAAFDTFEELGTITRGEADEILGVCSPACIISQYYRNK